MYDWGTAADEMSADGDGVTMAMVANCDGDAVRCKSGCDAAIGEIIDDSRLTNGEYLLRVVMVPTGGGPERSDVRLSLGLTILLIAV
jgi:hypothetical protein